jgi:hypothetical protein
MSYEPGAEFAAWMDAYQVVSADADKVGSLPCPHCGRSCLNLVYVVRDEAAESGLGAFWCGHCLFGLIPLNAPVPPGGPRVLAGTEDIPNYTLVVDDSEPIE